MPLAIDGVWRSCNKTWRGLSGESEAYVGRTTRDEYYRTKIQFSVRWLGGHFKRLIVSATPNQNSSPGYTTAILSEVDLPADKIYNTTTFTSSSADLKNVTIAESFAYRDKNKVEGNYAGYNNESTFYYIFDAEIHSDKTYYIYIRRGGPSGQGSSGWVGFDVSSINIELDDNYYYPEEYTVTYIGNGGSPDVASSIKYHSIPLEIGGATWPWESVEKSVNTTLYSGVGDPETKNTKVYEHHDLDRWISNTGKEFQPGDIYTTNEAMTLTAQWGYTQYITTSESVVALPNLTRTGYIFGGWYIDNEQKITGTEISPAADTKIYARWTPRIYHIGFDKNGGGMLNTTLGIRYGYTYEQLPTPTRLGYTFDGWYIDGTRITSNSLMNRAEDHTLVAKWTPIEYTVNLYKDGSTLLDTIKVNFDSSYEFPSPERLGYNFAGWTTNPSGLADSNKWVQPSSGDWKYTSGTNGIDSNNMVSLYAVWNLAAIQILYHVYDHYIIGVPILNVNELASVGKVAENLVKPHHRLTGWYTERGNKIVDWSTILSGAREMTGYQYPVYIVNARIEPRYKLLYIDNNMEEKYLRVCLGGEKLLYPYIIKD